jgi:hypothetical protein
VVARLAVRLFATTSLYATSTAQDVKWNLWWKGSGGWVDDHWRSSGGNRIRPDIRNVACIRQQNDGRWTWRLSGFYVLNPEYAQSNGGEYVYPEDDLRREFWQFVRWRAEDVRIAYDDRLEVHTLDELEDDRTGYLLSMYSRIDGPEEFRVGYGDLPVIYMKLQDALLAFFIYRVSSKKGFPYRYAVWLRTVVLVVMQAHLEPHLLTVRVELDAEGRPTSPASKLGVGTREYTMALDGAWECLSHDTFKIIKDTLRKRASPS